VTAAGRQREHEQEGEQEHAHLVPKRVGDSEETAWCQDFCIGAHRITLRRIYT
jgi:hypothetical protein